MRIWRNLRSVSRWTNTSGKRAHDHVLGDVSYVTDVTDVTGVTDVTDVTVVASKVLAF